MYDCNLSNINLMMMLTAEIAVRKKDSS